MNLEPIASASVFWVGHSLIEGQAETAGGPIDLMSVVGTFAGERGLTYNRGSHTLWGASLSALWRGQPHNYDRDAMSMVPKREAFEADPKTYDTLVMTEIVPLHINIQKEFSALYMKRFYCALKSRVPNARVFLYQTWVNFQAGHDLAGYSPPPFFDWLALMRQQSNMWRDLAKAACQPNVPAPGLFSRFGLHSKESGGCKCNDTIGIIPVGDALTNLAERLAQPLETDHFHLKDGHGLRLRDLVANPYVDWPEHWPIASDDSTANEELAIAKSLTSKNPGEPHDDIHLSSIGIYYAALVHFAVVYQQSPIGLSDLLELGAPLARTLQSIAWDTVQREFSGAHDSMTA